MTDFFEQFNPVTQAFIATLFTWGVTAAGAALVFIFRAVNRKLMDSMLEFAAGVMIAAPASGLRLKMHIGYPLKFFLQPVNPTLDDFILDLTGWFDDTNVMASTGQAATHLPQPLHSASVTTDIKLVV